MLSAYVPRKDIVAWGADLLKKFRAIFPSAAGGVARVFDLATRRPRGGYLMHACRNDLHAALLEAERASANRTDIVMHGRDLRRLCGPTLPRKLQRDAYVVQLRRGMRELGVEDMWHLTASDGESVCVTVGAMLPPGTFIPGSLALWSRVSRHFDAGLRLQRRVERLRAELAIGPDEAIVSPDGDILEAHGLAATPHARARLREIVRQRRSFSRSEAEEVWRGVLDGTWSIIERYAEDGRCYIVALPVQGPPDPRRLLPREAEIAALAAEGHSDKAIANILGVGRTTVATQLASALRKLGLERRVDLVRVFSPNASSSAHDALPSQVRR